MEDSRPYPQEMTLNFMGSREYPFVPLARSQISRIWMPSEIIETLPAGVASRVAAVTSGSSSLKTLIHCEVFCPFHVSRLLTEEFAPRFSSGAAFTLAKRTATLPRPIDSCSNVVATTME